MKPTPRWRWIQPGENIEALRSKVRGWVEIDRKRTRWNARFLVEFRGAKDNLTAVEVFIGSGKTLLKALESLDAKLEDQEGAMLRIHAQLKREMSRWKEELRIVGPKEETY